VAPTVFEPENLLREARRQKDLADGTVPEICVLDPDGDMVRHLRGSGRAELSAAWACYHTDMYNFDLSGEAAGIIGCAVGAPFAVLLAEQLFASGCRLLLSMTSAGQLSSDREPPYFVLIERALRDEGTSYHYQPPARFSEAEPELTARIWQGLGGTGLVVLRGATWTTDAPFRETEAAVAAHRHAGLLAVEMEAAALYAFARARARDVLCFAHVTNRMAQQDLDFEKGGAPDSLKLLAAAAAAWRGQR
jgi:uridine phosphorylase